MATCTHSNAPIMFNLNMLKLFDLYFPIVLFQGQIILSLREIICPCLFQLHNTLQKLIEHRLLILFRITITLELNIWNTAELYLLRSRLCFFIVLKRDLFVYCEDSLTS